MHKKNAPTKAIAMRELSGGELAELSTLDVGDLALQEGKFGVSCHLFENELLLEQYVVKGGKKIPQRARVLTFASRKAARAAIEGMGEDARRS